MKLNKLNRDKILDVIIIIFTTCFMGIYYYWIEKGFVPDGDELANFTKYNLIFKQNIKYPIGNGLWALSSIISYFIKGYSYDSVRLNNSIMYSLVVFLSLILILILKKEKSTILKKWYFLPFFVYMMGLLHDGKSKYFGIMSEALYLYPFDNHMTAIIFSLICLIFLALAIKENNDKKKKIYQVFFLFSFLYGMFYTDSLYLIILAFPLFVVGIKELFKKDSVRQNLHYYIIFFLLLILLLRILSNYVSAFSFLKTDSQGQYDGYVYGISNFGGIFALGERIYVWICGILGVFNCLFFDFAILNLKTFSYLVRFSIVIFYFYYCITYIYKWLKTDKQNKLIAILCLGSIMLSVVFILADFGGMLINVRYLPAILPYAIITLCVLSDSIIERINIFKWNAYLLGMFTFLILIAIYIQPVYKNEVNNIYEDELELISDTILDEKLGNGLAPFWAAYNISAKLNNEYYVDAVDYNGIFLQDYEKAIGRQADNYNYILLAKNVDSYQFSRLFNEDMLFEQFGRCDAQYDFNEFSLYYYEDGINDWSTNTLTYKSEGIEFNNKVIKRNKQIWLKESGKIYGPYVNLNKGMYAIKVKGENLLGCEFFVTGNSGASNIELYNVQTSNDEISYLFIIDDLEKAVEFVFENVTKSPVIIESINIKRSDNILYEYRDNLTYKFDDNKIQYMGAVEFDEQSVVIDNGGSQYGPYVTLEKGEYEIIINGDNLSKAEYFVKTDLGDTILKTELIKISEQEHIYRLKIKKKTDDVEVTFTNNTDQSVLFQSLEINKVR